MTTRAEVSDQNPLSQVAHPLEESAICDEAIEQQAACERCSEPADDESNDHKVSAAQAAADGEKPLRTVYGGEVDGEFFETIKAQSAAEREARLLAKRRPNRASLKEEGWVWALLRRFTHAWESEKPHLADGGYGNGERGMCTGI